MSPYEETYLSAIDLAERLGVASRTIGNWKRRGIIPPPQRIGRLARYWWPDVATAIRDRKAEK